MKLPDDAPPSNGNPTDLRLAVREFTLAHIRRVIEQHGGNKTRAAQALGVSRRTLQLKLRGIRDNR